MRVRVKLFAVARDRASSSAVDVELSPPATIGQLRTALAQQYPRLADVLASVRFALNEEYATDAAPIDPHAEIAIIPPVSGG
jgi:molybdopterin converting factor subunit 1